MGWTSGVFRLAAGFASGRDVWGQAEQADRDVRSDDHDAVDNEMADGINNCLTKDGQNEPTGNLPMGGQKHTGVADAEDDDDYAAWGQAKGYVDGALAPSIGTLTDQANIAWDVGEHDFGSATLAGDRRLANPTNAEEGGIYIFEAIQDATGGRRLAYDTGYEFGEDGEPELSSAAGKRDFLFFVYRNSKMNFAGMIMGR